MGICSGDNLGESCTLHGVMDTAGEVDMDGDSGHAVGDTDEKAVFSVAGRGVDYAEEGIIVAHCLSFDVGVCEVFEE